MTEHCPTCLVTGATSGIGEAIATRLAAQGAHVLAVARNADRGDAAVARIRHRAPDSRVDLLTADLAVLDQVRKLADQVHSRCGRLDVLILNAGVARPRRELTVDGFEVDFATNHLSPFLLTHLLDDLLRASAPSRVVTQSSAAHRRVKALDLDALTTGRSFHHVRTYSATKLLTVLFTSELARRLAGSGVTANAADPGFVRTALGRDATGPFGVFLRIMRPFQLSPDEAALTPVHVATSPDLAGTSGAYFTKCLPTTSSPLARDRTTAERLWALSTELVTQKVGR